METLLKDNHFYTIFQYVAYGLVSIIVIIAFYIKNRNPKIAKYMLYIGVGIMLTYGFINAYKMIFIK